MKILYFDCFAGISGDMSLGALVSLGVPSEYLINELKKLNVYGWEIAVSDVSKNGITAKLVDVILEKHEHHVHEGETHSHVHHVHGRNYADICKLIDASELNKNVKNIAQNIFKRVAIAESKVHNVPLETVTFHEVGALDSIIDIVGVAICVDYLNVDKILSSVVNDGYGFIDCAHGKIPVPVPAVVEIFKDEKVRARQIDVCGELVTPTGAAIVAELAENFGLVPQMHVVRVGYGAGTRQYEVPSVLRIMLLETDDTNNSSGVETDEIEILETNIDDTTPEILAYVMEKLFENGAKDVYFTNIQMKKNRPATKLTVLCSHEKRQSMEQIIFLQTSAIGIRISKTERHVLKREIKNVQTIYGEVAVKIAYFNGEKKVLPEYESAKIAANEHNVPLKVVYDEVRNGKKINCTLLAKNAILIKGDENGYYNKKSNYKDASFIE